MKLSAIAEALGLELRGGDCEIDGGKHTGKRRPY